LVIRDDDPARGFLSFLNFRFIANKCC